MYELVMREATANDYEHYYKIKCDKKNVEWSGFQDKPDYDKLKKRFDTFFQDDLQGLFLFEYDGNIVGYVNYFIVEDGKYIETSHGALSDLGLKALGFKMLQMTIQYIEKSEKYRETQGMIGWVAENNIASLQNVIKNGYTSTGEVEYRTIMGTNTKFIKFKKERSYYE